MNKAKFITGILIVLAVLFAQVGTVFAAPAAQDPTSVTGIITDIQLEKDAGGVVTAVVVKLDTGETVRVNRDAAQNIYGLVKLDPLTNQLVPDTSKINTKVTILPTDVAPAAGTTDVAVNPVAAILASFFGVDGSVVQGYHDDGFGFGVIAQALWMQKNLGDDQVTVKMILDAKVNKDYSAITLPDGSTPTNWGQFKKALLEKKNNLGVVVSGQADPGMPDAQGQTTNGNGHGNGKDNNPGKGKGKNKP